MNLSGCGTKNHSYSKLIMNYHIIHNLNVRNFELKYSLKV